MPVLLANVSQQVYQMARAAGLNKEDGSAVVKVLEQLAGVTVKRGGLSAMATYVLVHGAYQGGWIWKPVVERLRARRPRGLRADARRLRRAHATSSVPGITVGTHAQEVAGLLFYEDLRDIVLVGTSSGGMVICRAAELAADRIARLVFVDALALLPGERIADIVKRPAPMSTELTTGADARGRRGPHVLGPGPGHTRVGARALHAAPDRGDERARWS